jgi:amylosucrase
MHRPVIDWEKNADIDKPGTLKHTLFTATKKLIGIRKKIPVIADKKKSYLVKTA